MSVRPGAAARAPEPASRPADRAAAPAASAPTDRRDRLIDAMAASIEEKGYRDTTVADVVRLARTSRRWTLERGILAQDARVQLA